MKTDNHSRIPAPMSACELCGREAPRLTRHHLIPRTRHGNRINKRKFDRTEVHGRIAWLCRPCHDHVHATFTEKTLERDYNSLAALRADPEMARFIEWIRDRPSSFRPPLARRMRRRR